MVSLKILTLNIRGLNSPIKRIKCLDYLKHKNVDIAFLQETHLKSVDVSREQNKVYRVAAFSSAPNKTKGVVILVRRKLNLILRASGKDNEGRFCYVTAMLNRSKICLASIYAPNTFDINFFDSIKSTLLNFSDTTLILGGDFNLLVNPNIDSTNPLLGSTA